MSHANALSFPQLDGNGLKIGIISARYNSDIVAPLQALCVQTLQNLGVSASNIDFYQVPGALETGITLSWAASLDYDALIALGCVIRGETYHFELVANESASAITRVSQDYEIAIVNGILTTETHAQALDRIAKGADFAQTAVEMALLNDRFHVLRDALQDD